MRHTRMRHKPFAPRAEKERKVRTIHLPLLGEASDIYVDTHVSKFGDSNELRFRKKVVKS